MPPKKASASPAPKAKAKEKQAGEIIQCFQKIDQNNDGTITHDELAKVMRALDPKAWTDKKVEALLKDMDKDGDGKINVDDFVTYIMSSHPTDKKNQKSVQDAAAQVKKEDVEGPEGTDGKEALTKVLDTLFDQYDSDKDGKIERIEFLEGEEKRLGSLDFGPKPRREAMAWFKEIGAEGTPVDGMFVSREKWDTALKKLADAAVGADLKKQADWIFENRLKAILEATKAEEEAKAKLSGGGESASAPTVNPAVMPSYPIKVGFKEINERIQEAASWKRSVLLLSSGLSEVETYLTYQAYGVVDAKMYINEVFIKKAKTLDDARAEVKEKLMGCMNSSGFVKPVHIRLNSSAFDFVKFCEDGAVPSDIFDPEKWTPEAACTKGYIDEGHKFNVEIEDNKKWKEFHIVFSSTFDLEKAKEHLTDKIPGFDKLAIIEVDPNSIEKG